MWRRRMALWEYADVGFDTGRKLWVLQFNDAKGNGAGNMPGRAIELRDITSFQAAWPDNGVLPDGSYNPTNFWHIRQRILAEHVASVYLEGERVVVQGVRGQEADGEAPYVPGEDVDAVQFAYSRSTSKGLVELVRADGSIKEERLQGRWIFTENLTMRTVGEFPNIRLRAQRDSLAGLVLTGTTCTIVGRKKG
jgi:hypothetical protein